jgi:DNA-binding protein Fis
MKKYEEIIEGIVEVLASTLTESSEEGLLRFLVKLTSKTASNIYDIDAKVLEERILNVIRDIKEGTQDTNSEPM